MNELTQSQLKKLLYYDHTTGDFIWLVNRSGTARAGDTAGYNHTGSGGKTYREITINGRSYFAHRLAFLLMTGSFPEYEVDHEDGNGLNNKWDNLRAVTHNQNAKNRRVYSNNTSGCAGVSWDKRGNKWRVRIGINGKQKPLGYFTDLEEAVRVRKQAEVEHNYHTNHGSDRPL
jgi:hypothetical protein